jgi:hypothetical protein
MFESGSKIGIGTTNPLTKLHIYGSSSGVMLNHLLLTNHVLSGLETGVALHFAPNAANLDRTASIQSRQSPGTGSYADLRFFVAEGNFLEGMRLTTNKELIIGNGGTITDRGAFNLQCNGTGVWGAGAYTNGSDIRIKENIAPIASSLDIVKKLKPITYQYKEDWSKDRSIQTGFIAQDLLEALDGQVYLEGVVTTGGKGGEFYSVAYQNIIPILTKAIQELKEELDQAKSRIEALENNNV